MAGSGALPSEPATSPEVFPWLKNLPLAPEYHPTLAEFQDPIAYIFKIEKEASSYGICKIVPPVPQSPKKTAISNLNRSLLLLNPSADPDRPPTFTTRQQQIGFCPRKPRPVQKPVWHSGESYTYQEFEAKAKLFERNYLKKCSKKGVEKASSLSPLEIETLYWKATVDKPFSVEYANDMPGSAFSPKKGGNVGEGMTVGDTEWNMRGVSRAKGSLLRFMKEEIPGVTSPMVYVAMMFSWFAWHVEDHDLHSLNYLHAGAGKTWYGVPREAAVAFEEVVRVHGYGGEINPLVTFAVLGEKTTVISPEVIVGAGVPCCRLVQNPGEFVVTFPRAYHSGFSHGFNCGEAANIATPEWLRVAKDAAIRRASINYPPMVSHFQLLYDLAQELCTRLPMSISSKPRSSRLKDKQKGEGETLVKELFMRNVMQNNDLLHVLGKESSVVLLPRSSLDVSICSNLRVGSHPGVNPSLGLPSHNGMKLSKSLAYNEVMVDRNHEIDKIKGYFPLKGNFASLSEKNRFTSLNGNESICRERATTLSGDKLSSQRLFSCVKCGILCFDCVAVLQPREAAARYLMSADCSFLNDWITGSGVTSDGFAVAYGDASTEEQISSTRWVEKRIAKDLYDVPVQSVGCQSQMASEPGADRGASALGLLALTYGNSSDSDGDQVEADVSSHADEINMTNCSSEETHNIQDKPECPDGLTGSHSQSLLVLDSNEKAPLHTIEPYSELGRRIPAHLNSEPGTDNLAFDGTFGDSVPPSLITSKCSPTRKDVEQTRSSRAIVPIESSGMSFQSFDEDSSRMHIFCLEHAVEVEQQLRPIGGAHVLLFCHPEYPSIETKAKMVSEELGIDNPWNDIFFKEATKEDEEKIQLALDCEEAIPGNADWTVKLGINLFYSANLSWSPLYSKQMPYNSTIYDAFGRSSPAISPTKSNKCGRRSGKQRKVVAGKWCGRVWMSNQVHRFLVEWDSEENDPDQEQERSFRGGATPDEKFERKPHSIHKTEANLVTKKYRRKRKLMAESRSVKKVKCTGTESVASYDSAEDNSYKQYFRTRNSKQTKFVERKVLYNLLEDNHHKQSGRIPKSQQFISVEREDALSDDSLEDNTGQQHASILRSKPAKYVVDSENVFSFDAMERNSKKRHRRVSRRGQTKLLDREAALSEGSLENNSHFLDGRVGSKQTKFIERQDTFSDDSLDESSRQLHGKRHTSKQVKFVEDDVVSDDSLENRSYQQYRRISRGKKTKDIDSEDAVSNDSLEEYSRQQCKIYDGRKVANFIDWEDEFSDDLLGDDTCHKQKAQSSKHPKFVEMEDATSEDSIEYSHRQQRRVPRRRRAKFVETADTVSDVVVGYHTYQRRRMSKSTRPDFIKSEDVLSDQLQENHMYQQPRKSPKIMKAKFFAEEHVSDDMPLTMHRQLRKAYRGKQAKYIGTEEAVSDDSLEDDSNQQRSRVVGSKPTMQTALLKVKRKTSQQLKKGTPKLMKEAPQAIKLERQLKQETPRLGNNKNERSLRQFDSHAEENIEGGPSTRLRKRPSTTPKQLKTKRKDNQKTNRKESRTPVGQKSGRTKDEDLEYQCDVEGCTMRFRSEQELALHKRNVCPVKGCGKKFFSHKYLVQHRRVHLDDRPLKCPWKGCKMTFKWAWARTEHIRVHTGARPYVCAEEGCGQTFRFVSDFSRHKRKTGHSTKKTGG